MFAMINKVDTFQHRDQNTRRLSPLVANNVEDDSTAANGLLEPRGRDEIYHHGGRGGGGGAPTLLMLLAVNFPVEDDKTPQDMPPSSHYFPSSAGSKQEGSASRDITTLEILEMVLDLLDEDMDNDLNGPEDDKNHQIL